MKNRFEKIRKTLLHYKIDALLISSTPTITYLTNYSGFSTEEREAFLLIVAQPQGLTHKTPGVYGYLFTDGRYMEAVKDIPNFTLVEIGSKIPLTEALTSISKKEKITIVGYESDNLTVSEYLRIKKCFTKTKAITLHEVRIEKEEEEIEAIQKACALGDKAFDHILPLIKEGITEKELAFQLELFIKKQHADLSFRTIVAFGKNAAIPHHQTGNQRLASSGQFVLLDFGVKLNNYCSDMTRTVFFGKATEDQKRMYQTVIEAQKLAIDFLNHESRVMNHESIKAADVDKTAREYITTQGYPTIPHSLGHGIGIEVHETPRLSPFSKDILRPNMVFSIEPGIYIPGVGGVRIEDIVVLTKNGPQLLTKAKRSLIQL